MSGTLARFELSTKARRRSEDLAPAASTTCERSAMLAHPSTELVARAPCQLRHSHARSVRAARARLRQQRRLEVGGQDAQARRSNGGRRRALESDDHAGTFFLRGGFPELTGEVSTLYQIGCQHGATRQCWAVGWVHSPVVSMLCRS